MPSNNYTPRISIIAGNIKRDDAISETVIADLSALDRLSNQRRQNLDIKIYCQESDFADCRVHVANDWRDIVTDEHFQTSDFYYFHFGVFNELHHTMHHARRGAGMAVFFHNVTPPHFLNTDAETLIHKSYQQIENFLTADVILTASAFSARQLEKYNLGVPIQVVPLFGKNSSAHQLPQEAIKAKLAPLRLAYCGRFVPSKGIHHLMEALMTLDASELNRPIEITLAGNGKFSNDDYIEKLEVYAESMPNHVTVKFLINQDDEAIRALYNTADALILPSLHEGFGMPVVEALLSGTPVICSNAGSLPEISNRLCLTFRAGDINALAGAIIRFAQAAASHNVLCDLGELPLPRWRQAASDYAAIFTREAYIKRMQSQFATWLQPTAGWRLSVRESIRKAAPNPVTSELPNQYDCAIKGSLIADRFIKEIERPHHAIREALRLAFEHEQSEGDIAYWENVLSEKRDNNEFSAFLSNIKEVRDSPTRLQSSVYFKHAIRISQAAFGNSARSSVPDQVDAAIDVQFLLQDKQQNAVDFIRSAYRVVLRRDPDPDGLKHYTKQLQLKKDAGRAWLVNDLLESDEAKLLLGAQGRKYKTAPRANGFKSVLPRIKTLLIKTP